MLPKKAVYLKQLDGKLHVISCATNLFLLGDKQGKNEQVIDLKETETKKEREAQGFNALEETKQARNEPRSDIRVKPPVGMAGKYYVYFPGFVFGVMQ